MAGKAFIGVDAGTGSVRAGIFDAAGTLLGAGRHAIALWREAGGTAEQSSDDIWQAAISAVHDAMREAGVKPGDIGGIGFDATCSLVALDAAGRPASVSMSDDPARNVIVWMDHRALDQTARINATGHEVLRYVGGKISPEMETPKLLWLKENKPAHFARTAHFFDLADYLTWRASGSLARSSCTLACKWTYLAHERRWADDFFHAIGLGELTANGHARIGTDIVEPGAALGQGLSAAAAGDFGLAPGTPVAASLIDAHAGAIGTIGAPGVNGAAEPAENRLALIMGTSTCAMAVSREPRFVPGVWGPYYNALIPGLWLAEGGQSAAGAAIDHYLRLHPAFTALQQEAGDRLFEVMEADITHPAGLSAAAFLARDVHVLPDINGNRSPGADPHARGLWLGMNTETGRASLHNLYVALLCGLAYGVADIIDALEAQGFVLPAITVSGGASRSALVRQILADATGRRVLLPQTSEPVLLGAAMLGAVAGGACASLPEAMQAMGRTVAEVSPAGGQIAAFHARKRAVHRLMQATERQSRALMAG